MKMKKLISLLLVVCMLCSLSTAVFATTDYRNGTDVTYNPADPDGIPNSGDEVDNEAYTITVPAKLLPGTEGPVTLEGTWASNRIVTVTAEPSVEMVNSINANDKKTLTVTFAGISERGNNERSQKFVEPVKVSDISDALFGTWSGHFEYQVGIGNVNVSIPVQATDKDGNDLNATSTEIVGQDKTVLLDKLEESGIVASGTNVDALIEVKSDEFEDLAETTFDVSEIAQPGDKVVILHYDETKQEWEFIGEGIVQEDGTITASFSSYSPVGFVVVKDDGTTEDTWPVYFGKYYELVGSNREALDGSGQEANYVTYASGFVFYPDGSWIAYWENDAPTSSGAGYIKYKGDDLCIGDEGEYVYATLSQDRRTLTLLTGKQLKLCADPEIYYNEHYYFTPYGEYTDASAMSVVLKEDGYLDLYDENGNYADSQQYTKVSNKIILNGDYTPSVIISNSGTVLFAENMTLVCPIKSATISVGAEYGYSVEEDGETHVISIVVGDNGTFTVYMDGVADGTGTYIIKGDLLITSIGANFAVEENGNVLTMLYPDGDSLTLNKLN